MRLKLSKSQETVVIGIIFLLALLVACGTAAEPTQEPAATRPAATEPAGTTPEETTEVAPTTVPQETSTPSEQPVSAKDKAIAVVATEPAHLNPVPTSDAHAGIIMDTINGYIGHLAWDTLAVSPTPMIQSWKRTAPDTWEYQLRPDVTFHDGEPWTAEGWKTYSEFAGVPEFNASAYNHTGPYTVEVVDELTARIKCETPCPLFERALNLARSISPKTLKEQEFTDIREGMGTGPYKVEEWIPGQKIRTVAFEDFVPVPENPEYVAPILQEIEWQWREETTVRTAMVEAGEADWAFLLTIDDANTLGPDQSTTGGTSETAMMRIDTIFDPWLSQVQMRQAIVHAIDCQAIVDSLYQGITTCRGNIAASGVLGITDENIAPYEYDPVLSQQLLGEIGYICGQPNSASNCGAEISITSRGARISNNIELIESIATYLQDVGINAKTNIVEVGISNEVRTCGVGSEGAQVIGWNGATENKRPSCPLAQIVEHIGFGYELLDYGKIITRHMNCESTQSSVCVPEKQAEWQRALTLEGEERRMALEQIASEAHDNVYFIPLFDLLAIYGHNSKLRGFENPRFDKHLFANLWWFEE
jgi:ABC-type transport system substrate-binding protein